MSQFDYCQQQSVVSFCSIEWTSNDRLASSSFSFSRRTSISFRWLDCDSNQTFTSLTYAFHCVNEHSSKKRFQHYYRHKTDSIFLFSVFLRKRRLMKTDHREALMDSVRTKNPTRFLVYFLNKFGFVIASWFYQTKQSKLFSKHFFMWINLISKQWKTCIIVIINFCATNAQ